MSCLHTPRVAPEKPVSPSGLALCFFLNGQQKGSYENA